MFNRVIEFLESTIDRITPFDYDAKEICFAIKVLEAAEKVDRKHAIMVMRDWQVDFSDDAIREIAKVKNQVVALLEALPEGKTQ